MNAWTFKWLTEVSIGYSMSKAMNAELKLRKFPGIFSPKWDKKMDKVGRIYSRAFGKSLRKRSK